jgi:cytochrome oxidase Cu insertion factor (SCO1/SenC/PrrC family)
LKVLGIGLIAVAPVLGSYLLYLFWSPGGYTNYGTLLEPRRVPQEALQLSDGKPFGFDQLRGRWIFVVFDSGECAAYCEKKLWTIRQVRQAQGKDVTRIERVFFSDDGVAPAQAIMRDYAGTWFVLGKASAAAASFPATASTHDHIYLVDPQGQVMMRFPREADPKRMIRDLSRLLRYSRIG